MPVSDRDGWYEELMGAHRGLAEVQSLRLNCALVLLLAEQIGDAKELSRCLAEARSAALDQADNTKGVS